MKRAQTGNHRPDEKDLEAETPVADDDPNPSIPFSTTEWQTVTIAEKTLTTICHYVSHHLERFRVGIIARGSGRHNDIKKDLKTWFHVDFSDATKWVRQVNVLIEVYRHTPRRLQTFTCSRLMYPVKKVTKDGVYDVHALNRGHSNCIDIAGSFFKLKTASQQAVVLLHESIHQLQGMHFVVPPWGQNVEAKFEIDGKQYKDDDRDIDSHHGIPFDACKYQPYSYQGFACKLKGIPNPSAAIDCPPTNVMPISR